MDAIKELQKADKNLQLDQGYLALAAMIPCLISNEAITEEDGIQIMTFYESLRNKLDISRSKKDS